MIQLCVGILIGCVIGAVGMLLLVRETKMDEVMERQIGDIEDPWDAEELPDPKEVKYGDF